MAMAVLVVFEDDNAAIDFVEGVDESGGLGGRRESFVSGVTAPAMYKVPTMFHGAFETHGRGKTGSAWTLGQKWGWWVCAVCKKPSELYWDQIKKQSSFGKNIKGMFFTEENQV